MAISISKLEIKSSKSKSIPIRLENLFVISISSDSVESNHNLEFSIHQALNFLSSLSDFI